MTTLSTRGFLTFVAVLLAAQFASPYDRSAARAQSRKASHANVPLFVRLAGAPYAEATKALGKSPDEDRDHELGNYSFAGQRCGCDEIDVFALDKRKITSVRAHFNHELTWQEALKKVGISDKGVQAKMREHGPEDQRTFIRLTGISVVRPGFNVSFYSETYPDKKTVYELWIEK